jgi:hypothetical protein
VGFEIQVAVVEGEEGGEGGGEEGERGKQRERGEGEARGRGEGVGDQVFGDFGGGELEAGLHGGG